MADLSVIIVNYNSGWYCANLIEALQDQAFETPSGKAGVLEIIVVDNASPEDQQPFLGPLKDRGVRVVFSKENTGYGRGNNLGMRYVTSDWLMIVNPDVVLMPGSLQTMLEVLYRDPKAGKVGPRGWLDPGFHFLLPPVEMPKVHRHLYEAAGRVFKPLCKRYSLNRSRYALAYWSGSGPYEAETISGYCFLMPTALARSMGPFDEAFPFYYEDSDLSARLRKAGYRLYFVKDTRAIHFYNKSAGPVFDEVIGKYYRSKSYFFRKHYGPLGHLFYRASTAFLRKKIDRLKGSFFDRPEVLGPIDAPPELKVPTSDPVVVEITLDPAFVLAAGHFHAGETYRMPEITWRALDGTTWYLRILDGSCRRILASYQWEKATPAELPPPYEVLKGGGA